MRFEFDWFVLYLHYESLLRVVPCNLAFRCCLVLIDNPILTVDIALDILFLHVMLQDAMVSEKPSQLAVDPHI